ncbi:hypothetical protein HDE76_001475 [Rhodanobacter sp. ANJX3]|uniref:hypothetical protein n=1 Tax=Rhodanobacter sp. ANJX3 TaxID=2723083 RepID=UPI001614BEBC|nr:hypothetical protein [Rhodanobacter sp. ANJX3]MBB5358269.1 hypothetical protein [Rhodanobacter sp. ANJX3]
MTKPFLAASLALAILTSTTACGSSNMTTPDIKTKAHPTKRYELTVTIKDAPGGFDSMQTMVQYDVSNPFCAPTRPGSGATNAPDKTVTIPMTKTGENTYTGEFYADLMEDGDYYGKGVCHWQLTGVTTYLQHKNLMMTPGMSPKSIEAQKPETWYFSGLSYAQADTERVDVGITDGSKLLPSDHPFSVTYTAKERFQ